jgi:hypothetical protein
MIPNPSRSTWRKATHSNGTGGNCVEVTVLDNSAWRKSSSSGGSGGDCVEVAGADRGIAVRDSKDPEGPHLDFSAGDWQMFVNSLKTGRSGSPS